MTGVCSLARCARGKSFCSWEELPRGVRGEEGKSGDTEISGIEAMKSVECASCDSTRLLDKLYVLFIQQKDSKSHDDKHAPEACMQSTLLSVRHKSVSKVHECATVNTGDRPATRQTNALENQTIAVLILHGHFFYCCTFVHKKKATKCTATVRAHQTHASSLMYKGVWSTAKTRHNQKRHRDVTHQDALQKP